MRSPKFSFRAAATFLAMGCLASPVFGVSATTDPVGFITLNIAAAPPAGEQLSYKALGLSRPVEYQGAAEVAANSGGNSVVTDNDATWANDQFNPPAATADTATYYLEIARPAGLATAVPGEGTTFDILATDSATKTITLAGNLPTGVAGSSSVTFKIRKYWTIGDVFGAANEAGLGAGAQGEADDVMIYSPQTGQFNNYYYRLGGIGGSGWRNSNTGAVATNQKIYPEDGVLVRRRQTGDLNVTLAGAVKTGTTSSAVFSGINVLGNVYATAMTLGSSGLYTGDANTGVLGGAQGEADDVLIYDQETHAYRTYYYRIGGIGGSGWRSSDDGSIATDVSIAAGSAIVVRRRGATGFNWVAPQHPTLL